jgi:hypothetical protein
VWELIRVGSGGEMVVGGGGACLSRSGGDGDAGDRWI